MENFVSIALLLIVKVAEHPRSHPADSLTAYAQVDGPPPLPPSTFGAEPARQ